MRAILIATLILLAAACTFAAEVQPMPKLDTFNYAVGTQTFNPKYHFTDQPWLIETAKGILEMGSNTIKFNMSKGRSTDSKIHSLTELARDDSLYKQVLDMPFAYYIIWAYPFKGPQWKDPLTEGGKAREYKEMYEFATYLLKTYNGTDKRFYLGHWEGDWYLHENYDANSEPSDNRIQGMIDWLTARQKAVDDANKDTPHKDVWVYNYSEANLVKKGLEGKKCMAISVYPKVNLDYISYSSYDTQEDPALLKKALDLLESKLQPKPGIAGKRVWIGEYGFPMLANPPEVQDQKSRALMRAGLEWGCPFILYWQFYNNEVNKEAKQIGFWLIDDKNAKQPIYFTHEKLYKQAREYVADFKKKNNRVPTFDEYRKAAVGWLSANK